MQAQQLFHNAQRRNALDSLTMNEPDPGNGETRPETIQDRLERARLGETERGPPLPQLLHGNCPIERPAVSKQVCDHEGHFGVNGHCYACLANMASSQKVRTFPSGAPFRGVTIPCPSGGSSGTRFEVAALPSPKSPDMNSLHSPVSSDYQDYLQYGLKSVSSTDSSGSLGSRKSVRFMDFVRVIEFEVVEPMEEDDPLNQPIATNEEDDDDEEDIRALIPRMADNRDDMEDPDLIVAVPDLRAPDEVGFAESKRCLKALKRGIKKRHGGDASS